MMLRLPASRALKLAPLSLVSSTPRVSAALQTRTLQPLRPQQLLQPISTTKCVRQDLSEVPEHAVPTPMLANIEKRWEIMPPQEKAELWMALRDRMCGDWHQLTRQEKKVAYYIAFGPHGPRAPLYPPGFAWTVTGQVIGVVAICCVVFAIIRHFARPPPKTMTKEWQEMTNEYLKAQKSEAITGISSEGYKGKGMVQSGPGLAKYQKDDDE